MLPWTSMEDMKSVDKTNLFVSSMFDRMKTCHWGGGEDAFLDLI